MRPHTAPVTVEVYLISSRRGRSLSFAVVGGQASEMASTLV